MKNEIKCYAGWVRASLWLHPKQTFAESILRWGCHCHRCKPDVFISLSSYDNQVKPDEYSATLRLTPALAHWESSGTVSCSALVSSQSCFMGGILGEFTGHGKALVVAC